jgi:lysine-N-methylase
MCAPGLSAAAEDLGKHEPTQFLNKFQSTCPISGCPLASLFRNNSFPCVTNEECKLSEPRPIYPNYAQTFRCIGSECEDTCCHGWRVPVDEATYQRYQDLPPSPLQSLIHQSVERLPETGQTTNSFAIIRMNAENSCPMLSEERLCRIQSEYGAELLSHTCATYPRVTHTGNGAPITALTLSCPEAARLVLLHTHLLRAHAPREHSMTPAAQPDHAEDRISSPLEPSPLSPWTDPIRATVLATAANQRYPIWQRLFLLSVFAKRLDTIVGAIVSGELDRAPEAFLSDFNVTAARGSLRVAMDALPADELAQMDAVLRLAGLMLHRSNVGPRFVACVNAFTSGIGNGPGATLASLAAHARAAYERHFTPFFHRNPHILENYLVNTILRLNFPFGSAKNPEESGRTISQRFAILAAQFALIRGLLIGVAGHHGDSFSADHVVHTVQAASKHFEHHPEFAKQILALLAELKLDSSNGLTILLREPAPARQPFGITHRTQPRIDALRTAS